MEVNYGARAPFTLGVEEELQLLNPESCELTSRYEEIFSDAADGDARIRPELMQSTVEVATKPASTVAEALEEVRELRRRLRDEAGSRGYLVASAGTHPFSRWEHQEITDQPRYLELIDALQWTAERQLIFGLHVHVGLESAQQAIAVANALRTWLPELLAASANSPFWHGRDTGLASTRSKIFDAMPRSGLPPAFASFEEFELLVERGVRTGSFDDYTYIWWDLRPHPRLGTIEIRVCDAQTRIESVAALVALVQSLTATLAERYEREGALDIQPVTLIAENKWRAARYGLEARLVDLARDEERPAREALLGLVEIAEPAARRLGCAAELALVEPLLARGDGASEQRAAYEEAAGSPLGVARWLVQQTVTNV
ncbi:MAG: glutamate---cysteine ligase / carboxylate-amine ligase [Gaiellaceae bacterium]|jgi:carboxylate-amine ligase|nr:glutamate---cysteine ligase / carboxylate-amine ligase [Gaiellaceae bacterium]